MTGWRMTTGAERDAGIADATRRVLDRRSAAEGITVSTVKTQDGEYWVREDASGERTHSVWTLPGGAPVVLGDIHAEDGDAAGAWRAIEDLAAGRGIESVAFSAYRGDAFAEALAAVAPLRRVATKMQLAVEHVPAPERITTRPMTEPEFADYLEGSARAYADELLASGAFTDADAALAEAEASTARTLPEGLATPGQRLWTVRDERERRVGLLWVHLQEQLAFIYDIEMDESVRGQGFGTQALRAAAAHTRDAGLPLLALNVFGSNERARNLYSREGFTETEIIWAAGIRG